MPDAELKHTHLGNHKSVMENYAAAYELISKGNICWKLHKM